MFATATKNFVEEVDGDGLLIPVSSVNDSVVLLSLVVKCERFWFWQKPKYLPTTFTLNDVLTGHTPLKPVVTEADFIRYNGTFGVNVEGNAEANLARANMNVEGKETSKLQSSFGIVKKEEVDLQRLLQDSKDRLLDMSHVLVHQTREKKRQVFGVVKERIVITQSCSVTEELQQSGHGGGILNFCFPKIPKVSLKENSSLSHDSNVTMEIPPNTAIAYGLIELEVKVNGQYELCLLSNTNGSFEVDGPAKKELLGVHGAPVHESIYNHLKQELDKLSGHFQLLSSLVAPTITSLFQHIMKAMEDREAVSLLQNMLSQKCLGECPVLGDVLKESQRQIVQDVLDILEQPGGTGQSHDSTALLSALHLIVSALDEMADDCIAILGTFSPQVLHGLELLVQCVTGQRQAGLGPLTGETYEKAKHVFASSGVTLKTDVDTVKMEINQQPWHRTLVLSIAIRGLASLARSA